MAKMLLRTDCYKHKYSIAFLIRFSLFFGIPLFYYVFLYDVNESGFKRKKTNSLAVHTDSIDKGWRRDYNIESFSSRRILGLLNEPGKNCTPAAILDFPPDGFTSWQRRHGFIAIHCMLATYCFLLLGTVCEQYFVPAIKIICDRLQMAEDIAGATFMAAASSSPELFINCVGTFVTEGDLGVGTVVGSAVFNVLAVPACCGLLAGKVVDLDWWSVSRDCLMYGVAVVSLILALQDDRVYWHEALTLVSAYLLYILAMYFNESIGRFFKSGCCRLKKKKTYTEVTPLLVRGKIQQLELQKQMSKAKPDVEEAVELKPRRLEENDLESSVSSIWCWPDEKTSGGRKFLWVLLWPISFVLWATIPECRQHRSLTALTFIMCILWIGGVSYLVAWIITIVGDTLDIPDSIMGLTFLAAGTSVPEAVSSIIVTNQGFGSMGISNSIGSNTFDILLCLGLPWLVKSVFFPSTPGQNWVTINSAGLSYSAVSLLSTLLALYVALLLNKFRLDWKIGVVCTFIYIAFLTLASLIELNVFFPVNLPVCSH